MTKQSLCVGYLSSRLALEYKLKVLGIDSNSDNTENALKRNARLEVILISLTITVSRVNNNFFKESLEWSDETR